jgi:hypothetical protein
MMDAYLDSAVIVKLYVQEATSPDAIRLAASYAPPYILTQWQLLEVKNAIRLKAFRGEITGAEMTHSMVALEQDIALRRWQRPQYDAALVEQKAEDLSANYSVRLGCRTLDIIHVAAALVIGAREFVTFDLRQAALAKQVGLVVKS